MATTLEPTAGLAPPRSKAFTNFAWLVLGWNVVVVLWGAFVRATGSGAGCGSHWPLCNGDVLPRAPALATVIEFTHRLTSGVALIGVVAMLVMAFRSFPRRHPVRRFAVLSLVFIVAEALLGAGLVLLRYVEKNASVGRAIYLSAHLANTQLLLGALALTVWFSRPASHGRAASFSPLKIAVVLPVVLLVGISGAIAALGDTLFPASSLADGVRSELSATAHFLVRLRVFHPALAILSAICVALASLAVIRARTSPDATRIAFISLGLLALQMILGALNVVLLAPVWMQIVHLLFADFLWVALVLLVAESAVSPLRTIR